MKLNMKSLCFLELFEWWFFMFLRLLLLQLVCCVCICTVEVGAAVGARQVFAWRC